MSYTGLNRSVRFNSMACPILFGIENNSNDCNSKENV